MIQETMQVSSKQKIQPLENRCLFLPWQFDYSKLKKQFQSMGLPYWKTELLKLAKQSLRMKVNVESCASMTSLGEFEGFIHASYISGMNLLTDLFSVLFEMSKASSLEESQKIINEALNEYRIIKKWGLWGKLAQEHIDRTVSICLTKMDEEEFEREWSKLKVAEFTLLGSPLDMDYTEEDENVIDMDRSIATKSTRGCLEKKKKFLINFLTRKLVELRNRKTSARNLNIDRLQRNSIQLKKGEKVFQVSTEESDPEEGHPQQ